MTNSAPTAWFDAEMRRRALVHVAHDSETKPAPMPNGLVVTHGSKRRSMTSAESRNRCRPPLNPYAFGTCRRGNGQRAAAGHRVERIGHEVE